MTVTVPVVLILGVTVAVALKYGSLRGGVAVLAILFGFYLAATGAAQPINEFMTNLGNTAEDINP